MLLLVSLARGFLGLPTGRGESRGNNTLSVELRRLSGNCIPEWWRHGIKNASLVPKFPRDRTHGGWVDPASSSFMSRCRFGPTILDFLVRNKSRQVHDMDIRCEIWLEDQSRMSWLSQANHIFSQIPMKSNYEDYCASLVGPPSV